MPQGDPSPQPTTTRPASRRKGWATLRLVIGFVSALTVLVVASATFAITYTQSLTTVRDTGLKYASAITTSARIQITDYFDVPTNLGLALQRMYREPGFMLPSDDPTVFDVANKMATILTVTTQYNREAFPEVGMLLDDGSYVAVNAKNAYFYTRVTNCRYLKPGAGCCCENVYKTHYFANMSLAAPIDYTPEVDHRFNLYVSTRNTLQYIPTLWSTIFYSQGLDTGGYYAMPSVFGVFNTSRLIGFMSIPVRLNFVTEFIKKNLTTTPNSHTFILDNVASIVATSHPTSPTKLVTVAESKGAPNCAESLDGVNSGSVADPNASTMVLCRAYASAFDFSPLQVASTYEDLMSPTPGTTVVTTIASGSDNYFAAAAGIKNSMPNFKLTALLLMPDTDILGDIYTARNTVLIIIAVILIVAAATSFAVTTALLRPLDKVSKQMVRTSRLRDVDDDNEMSAFEEIRNLQNSYYRMNTAIKSFTRYVPKEVVQDLMLSGQLCEIKMQTMRCSMLFVDIAGFTSMCERVPSDELSRLVKSYFETMSGIVMSHEGLIDKFIGDCIMAVWGAPFGVSFQEVKATLTGLLIDRATRVAPLSGEFDAAGEVLSVRVGIATGEVLAGNMGSEDRMSYTVIGDPVNLAARLESMNKQFGTRVMIAEATAAAAKGIFALRELMHIAVVGKVESCRVYEVVGLRDSAARDAAMWEMLRSDTNRQNIGVDSASTRSYVSASSAVSVHRDVRRPTAMVEQASTPEMGLVASEADLQAAMAYSAAVEAFHERELTKALSMLDGLAAKGRKEANDKAAHMLRNLCEQAIREPSASNFDGVWRADEK